MFGNKSEGYKNLLLEVMPGIIETEEENERAAEFINNLMKKGEDNLSPDENKIISLIIRLMEDYEEQAYPELGHSSTPLDMLKFYMDQRGLKSKDIEHLLSGSGNTSLILNGKREISKKQAKSLAAFFNTSPADFI